MANGGRIIIADNVIQEFKSRKWDYLIYVLSKDNTEIVLQKHPTILTPPCFLLEIETEKLLEPVFVRLVDASTILNPDFGDLSNLLAEIREIIFRHCTGIELLLLSSTCKSYWHSIMKPNVWECSTRHHLSGLLYDPLNPVHYVPRRTDYITTWKAYNRFINSLKIFNQPHPSDPKHIWNKMISNFPIQDCCYAMYLFKYEDTSGKPREKLLFILWAPENARTKSKMLYTASKCSFIKAFQPAAEILMTDEEDTYYECVREKYF